MIIGEVCLLTNNVRKLADFYKQLLGIDNNSNDEIHQFIISEGDDSSNHVILKIIRLVLNYWVTKWVTLKNGGLEVPSFLCILSS